MLPPSNCLWIWRFHRAITTDKQYKSYFPWIYPVLKPTNLLAAIIACARKFHQLNWRPLSLPLKTYCVYIHKTFPACYSGSWGKCSEPLGRWKEQLIFTISLPPHFLGKWYVSFFVHWQHQRRCIFWCETANIWMTEDTALRSTDWEKG